MTIRAALVMALIAVGIIATSPRPVPWHDTDYVHTANWVITDLPSDPNSATFRLKAGDPAEVFHISHGHVIKQAKQCPNKH